MSQKVTIALFERSVQKCDGQGKKEYRNWYREATITSDRSDSKVALLRASIICAITHVDYEGVNLSPESAQQCVSINFS